MSIIIILGLGGEGKTTDIRSYIINLIREREDHQRIVLCDDPVAEHRKESHSLWSTVLAEGLEKVYESVTSKMRSMVSDCPYHCDFVRYHEHTYTAPMKSLNVVNSQFSVQVNHINLPTSSIASAFRSLCSNRCMLWNGAAALRQRREQSSGNYRVREGFQFRVKIASVFNAYGTMKRQRSIMRKISDCRKFILLKRPSTVQMTLALC